VSVAVVGGFAGCRVFARVVGAGDVDGAAFVVGAFSGFFAVDIAGGWVSTFGCDAGGVGFAVFAGVLV
jgi:hypothetical protein